MKAKQQTKNAKTKPQRKLPDLPMKKDVRGGGDIVITKTTDKAHWNDVVAAGKACSAVRSENLFCYVTA